MPRFCNSLDGCIINLEHPLPIRTRLFRISQRVSRRVNDARSHIRGACLHFRRERRAKLVSPRSSLHGGSAIQQGVRGVPTSRLPRWSKPHILVLYRCAILPNQPIPGCPRCLLSSYPAQPLYLGSLVQSGKSLRILQQPNYRCHRCLYSSCRSRSQQFGNQATSGYIASRRNE